MLRDEQPNAVQDKEHELRQDLDALRHHLALLIGNDAVELHVSAQYPLAVTYKWYGTQRDDRFLLHMKIGMQTFKILNLWLPPAKRGLGIGSTIVSILIVMAGKHGTEAILIEPRPGSEGFWKQLAFIPLQDDENGYWIYRISRLI